ncbi:MULTISPECIES: hypothetical protein [Haladaptatus]|uniref:DUF7978 domain-containing protein n=2 Tax=Haladaptatus paucihalophilus DX253 TaxID=797209 RepID=A0A1M6YRQ9_HALPU|nr:MULTISPECIES: hypothetical protein [Haladaptatus]GKZ15912.1 hypothetical protein HAL_37930 [Haladaptatus sp. T7]SHL21004.1 hypothetical protein SAMN05444342_3277 [Haladaptatus paucihalophilus DX253]
MESTATSDAEPQSMRSKRLASFCTRGFTFGLLSYLVGYLLVAALFVVGPANVEGPLDVKLKWFGFAFYNAHFIPIAIGSQSYNYISQASDPAVPPIVYYAIPVVSLLATSAVFSARNRLGETVETVVYSGASITVGYAAMAIVGAFTFTLPILGMTAQPDLQKAAAIGAAYPIVLATVTTFAVVFLRR